MNLMDLLFNLDFPGLLSLLFALLALVFSIKLSKEAGYEKYWVFLILGSFSLSLYILLSKIFTTFFAPALHSLVLDLCLLVGTFSLAYAFFGLYASLRKIREKFSKELE